MKAEAHSRGLEVGLKNDVEQVGQLVGYFDWQLNEECFQYDECEALLHGHTLWEAAVRVPLILALGSWIGSAGLGESSRALW